MTTGWLIDDFNLDTSAAYWVNPLTEQFVNHFVYFLLMVASEGFSGGRSIGKFCTRTRAVRTDNAAFGWIDAFMRTIVRLIPIECLSIFWTTVWHDKWTNTRVVQQRH